MIAPRSYPGAQAVSRPVGLLKAFCDTRAALRDTNGRAVGAISLGGPRLRLPAARLAPLGVLVRAAADRLSHRLGAGDASC